MMSDGCGSHGGGAEGFAGGDEAGGLRPALPAFAGGVVGAEGHSATQVAAITGSSIRSVQSWCATWRRSKVRRQPQKALAEQPRLGRYPVVPDLDHAKLLEEVARDPLALGYAATNWTVPLLATHLRGQGYPVSARTLRRRLHAAGLRWKRPRFVFAEPAPHVAQKKGRSCAP